MRVRRTGGFAGLTRSGSADLGDPDRPDVSALVDALRSASAADQTAVRDGFVYHVSLDDEPELTIAEGALPDDARRRVEQALGQ